MSAYCCALGAFRESGCPPVRWLQLELEEVPAGRPTRAAGHSAFRVAVHFPYYLWQRVHRRRHPCMQLGARQAPLRSLEQYVAPKWARGIPLAPTSRYVLSSTPTPIHRCS